MLDLIRQSEAVTIGEESKLLYINQEPTTVQVSKFLYDLQQPNKKVDQSEYSKILALFPVEPELVANTYAKQIIQGYESDQEFFPTQQSPQSVSVNPKQATRRKKVKIKKTNKNESESKKWDPFFF